MSISRCATINSFSISIQRNYERIADRFSAIRMAWRANLYRLRASLNNLVNPSSLLVAPVRPVASLASIHAGATRVDYGNNSQLSRAQENPAGDYAGSQSISSMPDGSVEKSRPFNNLDIEACRR